MARTSKSRGASPFAMKSSNRTTFKMMGSSPAKKPGDKSKDDITWSPEQKVSERTTETPTSTDVTTKYKTTGTSKGFEAHSTPDEAFTNWKKKNPTGDIEQYKKEASEWRKSQEKTHEKGREEVVTTPKTPTPEETKEEPKEGKMCHCKGIQQNEPGAGGSVQYRSWEKYLCDGPVHPNCTAPSGKGKGGRNILTSGSSSNTASRKSRK